MATKLTIQMPADDAKRLQAMWQDPQQRTKLEELGITEINVREEIPQDGKSGDNRD